MNVRAVFAPSLTGRSDFAQRAADLAYRPDIDGLRAVAVLAVVGFHYFPEQIPGGFVGVDVFFVISGYLITGILLTSLQNGTFSLAGFYSRRARRIFPALAVVLAASFVLGWAVLMPLEFKQLGKQIVAGTLFVSNFLFWSEAGYFDSPEAKPLLHLWSLSIEEQFYIVWPLLLWFVWKRKWPLLSTVAGISFVSFVANVIITSSNPVAGFYSPICRAWELGLGAALACWQPWLQDRSRHLGNRGFSAIGLLMIGGTIFLLDKTRSFPGWWAAIPVLGSCLVIMAGPASLLNRRVLSLPVLVWIGLISYPLYLWHWVLLTFARASAGQSLSVLQLIGLVLLSIVLANLTYRFVEKPIRSGGIRPVKVAALIASLAMVAVIGSQAWRNGGFPMRYNALVQAMAHEAQEASANTTKAEDHRAARKKAVEARSALLSYSYDAEGNALRGQCWITREVADTAFDACLPQTSASKPRILVWGDSHAARLYPGLKLNTDLSIGLTARDICPATLKGIDPGCIQSNQYVLSLMKKDPPDVVILFAAWFNTQFYKDTEALLEGVGEIAKEVRELGVEKVIIVGPTPHWATELPKIVFKHWTGVLPPRRLRVDLKTDAFEVDRWMRQQSWPRGVEYFSMTDVLCDHEGCLTYVPGSEGELTSYNYGHLTIPAAAFVGRKMNLHR